MPPGTTTQCPSPTTAFPQLSSDVPEGGGTHSVLRARYPSHDTAFEIEHTVLCAPLVEVIVVDVANGRNAGFETVDPHNPDSGRTGRQYDPSSWP